MLHVAEVVAGLCCTLFAGAAVYINLVEHPARMALETGAAARQWAPSYKRAAVMQATLAIVSFLAGTVVWLLGAGVLWLVGALVIFAVVPFTLIAIMPTNHRLLEPRRDLGSSETRELLVKWGRLHAVRSVLSLIASVLFLILLCRV